jgi:predicted amidohydrolase YtcJ
MNPRQPRAEALAVHEGSIVAVGSWEDVEPYAGDIPVLDLTGKTVVPGMIDTHTHFLWTALSLAALDVSGAENHPTLQEIIHQAVAVKAPGEPILGMGFTEYALDTAKFGPITLRL